MSPPARRRNNAHPADTVQTPMAAMAQRVTRAESALREALTALRMGRGADARAVLEKYQADRENSLAPGRKN